MNTAQVVGSAPDELVASAAATATLGLLGRVAERRLLAERLHAARECRGGALVLRGEAGIGKSALLEDLADKGQDCVICRVGGVESEMELPYAGLHQLCGPIMARLADLSEVRRRALQKVFGLDTGAPPDRFLVGLALLELLTTIAQDRTVIWLIDDAQWLDRSSLQAIVFAGRRLQDCAVAIVIAARGNGQDANLTGLDEIRLGGLSPVEAGYLLDAVVPGPTDPSVRDRIIAETHGNPLALLELPRAWTAAELVEGLAESARVPVTSHLELAFAKRLSELPPDTQTLLALAAGEPKGDPQLLWAAAQLLGLDWNAAAPAEAAGLIEFSSRVHFRHPLVRAAAYRAAPVQKRLEVHRVLAEVTDPVRDPDRRAWHRASSTVAHDEAIAVELEQSAGRAKARGGLAAAAALLERAAVLTPDGSRRANRLLAAARAKRDAGALDASLRLLSAAETEQPSELRGALAEQLRGRIAFDERRGEQAAELLLNAAQRLEQFDPRLARDTHLEALAAAVWASGESGQELIHKAAEAARGAPVVDQLRTSDVLLDALASRVTDGYEVAAPKIAEALSSARNHVIGVDDVTALLWVAGNRAAGILATEAWDYETGRALAERQVAVARESGALVQLQFALNFLANNVAVTGDVRAAAALVAEERALSAMTQVPPVGYSSVLVDAFRGDAARALPTIKATIETARNDGQGRIVAFANYVGSVLYNGLGRHAQALDCARRVIEWDTLGYQTLAIAEMAEAASRGYEPELLEFASDWVQVRAVATPSEWALGISARVQALHAAEADEADTLYRKSINHLNQTPLRVEVARSHLLYGEWLRRRGQRGEARVELVCALDALTEMGIAAFAHRARRELSAATRRRTRRSVDAPSAQLTSQETQIAGLIHQGLTNREIGGRLFLSPRTVEWHLRNIFAKVGVASRRQLRDQDLGDAHDRQ